MEGKRPHSHDVRMLAVVGRRDADAVLVSGGNDARLQRTSVPAFQKVGWLLGWTCCCLPSSITVRLFVCTVLL